MEEEYFEQHWLFNSNPIKIGQRYRTDKEMNMLIDDNNKDKVNVTCYGKTETMSRKDAIQKYFNCMICSEGAEQQRYVNIYTQLKTGCTNCTDEK